jgi:glycosyltransferase involved in cell wall biosynthesis
LRDEAWLGNLRREKLLMSPPLLAEHSRKITAPAATSPTQVLHLINGEHYSGAERVQDLLALRLPDFDFRVGFACLKPDRFPKMRRAQSAPLYEVPMRGRWDWRGAARVADIVRRDGYELRHAHTPRSLLIGRQVARRTGLPLIYHVHSPVGRDSTRGLKNSLNQWIETRNLRSVDRMICVSRSIAGYMLSLGHSEKKLTVVPNGVPTSTSRRQRDCGARGWTIGTVALFRPRKGIEVLLAALARLRQQGLAVRLLAVGPFETPAYERAMMEQSQRLNLTDAITWTGFCRDVESRLLEMDVFVLPSLFGEGLPMVVLEAMAVGLPVVASRVEGTPEAVRDELDGLIFEPGDADHLARQLTRLIEGNADWAALSQSALARQQADYSDVSMARGVSEVYRALVPRRV